MTTVARARVHYRRLESDRNRCGTTVSAPALTCGVGSCNAAATAVTEAADHRGVLLTREVCYGHGQAFLAAAAQLQRLGLVERDWIASVRDA